MRSAQFNTVSPFHYPHHDGCIVSTLHSRTQSKKKRKREKKIHIAHSANFHQFFHSIYCPSSLFKSRAPPTTSSMPQTHRSTTWQVFQIMFSLHEYSAPGIKPRFILHSVFFLPPCKFLSLCLFVQDIVGRVGGLCST